MIRKKNGNNLKEHSKNRGKTLFGFPFEREGENNKKKI